VGLAAAVAAAGAVVAVRLTAGPDRPAPAVLVWGASLRLPDNFFPLIAAGNFVATGQLEAQVLPAPFRVLPDLTVVPDRDLLTAEPTSVMEHERQVVTYRLDPRARWSDGDPIDAADFEFTWRIQHTLDPARGGCKDVLGTVGYDQISAVDSRDDGRTAVVAFSRPYADWKSLFGPLIPAHLMDSADPARVCAAVTGGWPGAGGIPVSGGPWRIEAVDTRRATVSFVPNPAYWGPGPKLDRVIWQSVPDTADSAVVVEALRAGELDLVTPSARYDLVDRLRALAPAVVTDVRPGLTFDHLDLNVQNVHLGRSAVRRAIATALDRPAVVRATIGQIDPSERVLNNRMYLASQPEYVATNGGRYERGDVPAARRLLAGAGYTAGPDGIYVKDGARLTLRLITVTGDQIRANAAKVIAAQLRGAGIEVQIFASTTIFSDKHTKLSLESGDFELALFSWVGTPFVTANQPIYASPRDGSTSQNYSRGADPAVDELFGRLAVEARPDQAAAIANRIDALLWQDLYTIPLYQRPIIAAHDGNFRNIVANPSNVGIGWNASDWELRR
jgi:peptide/nickel transport system substrate-binding protein